MIVTTEIEIKKKGQRENEADNHMHKDWKL